MKPHAVFLLNKPVHHRVICRNRAILPGSGHRETAYIDRIHLYIDDLEMGHVDDFLITDSE